MQSPVFEKTYNGLNPAQKMAVDTIEGPVMVIAGPGTGKTTILTLRIANILKRTDTAPENILALTFTESGAYNMRKKLAEIIGSRAYKVHIHTFHGFASHVIEQYPDYFPRIIGSRVITEPEQIVIIQKIIRSKKISLLRPYGDQDYYISHILKEIQILKRENISPKALKESIESSFGDKTDDKKQSNTEKQNEKNIELAYVFAEYEKLLAREKYYDFEDMLLELIRAVESDGEFKLMLQEQYQYILADEHQDANASQNRILEQLCDFHDSPNLFIVGDDKQAIYRFQGASLDNFLYFKKKYREAVVIDLTHNYRSHQGILDASHSLISNNPTIPGHDRKKLVSLQVGSAPIYVSDCLSINDEQKLVARSVLRLIENGESSDEIAVLYRDNKHAEPISRVFKSYGIEHRIESDNNILDEPDVLKLIILAQAIHDPSQDDILAKALFLGELGCDTAHVATLCREASHEKRPLYTLVERFDDTKMAYKRLTEWSHEAQIYPCMDFLQKVIQGTNMIENIVKDPNSLERLYSLQVFYDHIADVAKSKKTFFLADFIQYLAVARERGISSRRKYADHLGGVRLMTAHRAKGLEFNHVFIVHASDGIWGNRKTRNHFTIPIVEHARPVGRIEDERRLFFVAMTRARESVHITYARHDGEKEMLESQFISEIDPTLIDYVKIDIGEVPADPAIPFGKPKKEMGVSILKPDFVREKFLSQPLSVTHLNNYLECPWRYFFVNLIRVPQIETKHQMYGTAIHAALRAFFNAYRDGRDLNTKKTIQLFKHALDSLSLSKDDREETYKKGRRALEGYIKTYEGTWSRRLVTEYSIKGAEIVIPRDIKLKNEEIKIELSGKLDKVEYSGDNNSTLVVDFKTAKPKSRNEIEGKTKNADGNYKRQLVFYKLLLDQDNESKHLPQANILEAEIDFIEPNERGNYKKERFQIGDQDVDKLKEDIVQMAKEIIDLGFVNKCCEDEKCEYCRLGKLLNDQ